MGYGNFTTDASGAGSVAFVPNDEYSTDEYPGESFEGYYDGLSATFLMSRCKLSVDRIASRR